MRQQLGACLQKVGLRTCRLAAQSLALGRRQRSFHDLMQRHQPTLRNCWQGYFKVTFKERRKAWNTPRIYSQRDSQRATVSVPSTLQSARVSATKMLAGPVRCEGRWKKSCADFARATRLEPSLSPFKIVASASRLANAPESYRGKPVWRGVAGLAGVNGSCIKAPVNVGHVKTKALPFSARAVVSNSKVLG